MSEKSLTDFLKGLGMAAIVGAVAFGCGNYIKEEKGYSEKSRSRTALVEASTAVGHSRTAGQKEDLIYLGIKSYKIPKGKTLGNIARELGLPISQLESFNLERGYIEDPKIVNAGDYLVYPSNETNNEYGLKIIETPAVNFRKTKSKRKISEVVIHINDGGNMSGLRELAGKNKRGVSAHYDIFTNGDVHRLVQEKDSAQHVRMRNSHTLGIEFAGRSGDNFTEEQIESGSKLVAGILRKYDLGIDALKPHSHYDSKRRCNCPGKDNFNRIKERAEQLIR